MRLYKSCWLLMPLLLGSLVGCATDYHKSAQGDSLNFSTELSQKYHELSVRRLALLDLGGSSYYQERSKQASDGKILAPENPRTFPFEEPLQTNLEIIYQHVVNETGDITQNNNPKLAAQTLVAYDCLISNLKKDPQSVAAQDCKKELQLSLAEIKQWNSVSHDITLPATLPAPRFIIASPLDKEKETVAVDKDPAAANENNDVASKTVNEADTNLKTADSPTDKSDESSVLLDTPKEPQTSIRQDIPPRYNPVKIPDTKTNTEMANQSTKLYTVYFDHGTGIPSKEIKKTIVSIAKDIRSNHWKDRAIVLNAYTDPTGPKDFNQFIAEKRAKAIKDLLVAQNIPADSISFFAFGESQDTLNEESDVPSAKDRRVDILIGQ